jgi:L-threonylcarbamoyladenylate synthase
MARHLDCRDPQDRDAAIAGAVRAARNGRLVALPAESGYVLATDAFTAAGVAALQRAKGLDQRTSLGVLVGHRSGVHGIATGLSPAALELMAAFWPGQLSLIVQTQRSLHWTVPTDRCAVRMPLHPVLLAVVAGVGPMVYSGLSDPAERDRAAVVLDCGERPAGAAATLIDATHQPLRILREGAIEADRLRSIVPSLLGPN